MTSVDPHRYNDFRDLLERSLNGMTPPPRRQGQSNVGPEPSNLLKMLLTANETPIFDERGNADDWLHRIAVAEVRFEPNRALRGLTWISYSPTT